MTETATPGTGKQTLDQRVTALEDDVDAMRGQVQVLESWKQSVEDRLTAAGYGELPTPAPPTE